MRNSGSSHAFSFGQKLKDYEDRNGFKCVGGSDQLFASDRIGGGEKEAWTLSWTSRVFDPVGTGSSPAVPWGSSIRETSSWILQRVWGSATSWVWTVSG